MRHQKKQVKLGRKADHRNLMLRNLATSIILYEKVKTTDAKAKAVAPFVEKLITVAKTKSEPVAIREINTKVLDKNACRKLIQDLKKRYADRTSGYTRVTSLGFRQSDSAPISTIELTK